MHDERRKIGQGGGLLQRERRTRAGVHDAQGSDPQSVRSNQWRARIEPDYLAVERRLTATEARILLGVRHYHDLVGERSRSPKTTVYEEALRSADQIVK